MNSFERFNIKHQSPSSLNLWISSPGLWAYRYLGKVSDKGNAKMWCGSAVENGFAAHLRGGAEPHQVAMRAYDLNCAGEITDEIETERGLIAPMLDQCLKWQPPGPLLAAQIKVEHFFDPVPIPIIGYLDFAFGDPDDENPFIDVDLKTTRMCPSAPRPDHIRQVSLYRAARGRAGGILYVTPKKFAYYDIDDESMEIALEELRAAALSLNNFLARMETKEDVLRSLPVDWGDFRAPKTKVPLADILMAG